jgi:hypothetical protein
MPATVRRRALHASALLALTACFQGSETPTSVENLVAGLPPLSEADERKRLAELGTASPVPCPDHA